MKTRPIRALIDIDTMKPRFFKPVIKQPERGSIKELKEVKKLEELRKFINGNEK